MPHINGGFRGTRVGVPVGTTFTMQTENPDAEPLARLRISYWCCNGHETSPVFAQLAPEQIPQNWDCVRCGQPAGRNQGAVPAHFDAEPFKTHLEYVKERRSAAEAEQLLENALDSLRFNHKSL